MTFDAASYTVQLQDKVTRLRDLLAPFDAPQPQVFDSPLQNFRLRAEFRLWREAGNATTQCSPRTTSARRS